ncbi:Dbl homology domain-containing protein [Absidia repens]|uniref:Dbl homology domain-containing protein n=1 Tax=Absidia repens TaxID=90262 RepID=A0A1X2IXS9_9FUNG|nr:Dbl homology domain-containing protein [Absidia repens]
MSFYYQSNNSNSNTPFYKGRRLSNKDDIRQHQRETDYYFEENSSVSSYATTSVSGSFNQTQRRQSDQTYEIQEAVDYYYDMDTEIVDHELLHRSREALIQQLYSSEKSYLHSLDLIMNLFLYPLRHALKQHESSSSSISFLNGSKKPACTRRELQWLFCNLDDIYQMHKNILKAVEQRLNTFSTSQIISDVLFDTVFNYLGRCYGTYLDNYHVIVTTYERLLSYAPFKKFIDVTHKDPSLKGATLLSLLQIPTGCVNRYIQIVIRLADATSPMHPDYSGLQNLKESMLGLSEEIRPKIDNADNIDQVLMIHQALVEAPFGSHADRRLILQGDLNKLTLSSAQKRRRNSNMNGFSIEGLKKASSIKRMVILFSDMLLYVQARHDTKRTVLQYKGHIDLENARVQDVPPLPDGSLNDCFEVVTCVSGIDAMYTTIVEPSRSHIFQTKSQEEREDWLYHLSSVISELRRSATKARSRLIQEQRTKLADNNIL